jgi:phosphatidylglycerophosphate synthase
MLDGRLREIKERILRPIAQACAPIDPTAITLTATAIGLVSAAMAAIGQLEIGLLLWGINRVLDGLDGTVARLTGRQSDLGAYLDILTDHLVYAAIPLGLAYGQSDLITMTAGFVMIGAFYINSASWMYLAALLEQRNQGAKARGELTSITMPTGLIEGAETVVIFSLFFVWKDGLALLFVIMALLVAITIAQRLIWAIPILQAR